MPGIQKGRLYAWNYKTTPVMKKRAEYEKPDPRAILLEKVTSEGFSSGPQGYKFRILNIEYSNEYRPSAIVLYVQKPDGTLTEVTVKEGSSVKVGNINIASPFCGSVEESAAVFSAALWVW